MILFAVGMLLTYVGVAYERFHKTVAALAGAGVLTVLALALGLFDYEHIYEILSHELNIFGVIVGTGILVDVTGRSGLFHFLSMQIVRATAGRAGPLYLAVCLLTFAFVALLTIVPAMLIVCSLVLVICRSLDYDPKPFLLSTAICANSGAIVTFASGLPNIMIGTSAGIPYVHFLMVSAPYAVVSLVFALGIMRFMFRRSLPWRQSPEQLAELKRRIDEFDPWAMVDDRRVLLRSAVILVLTVLGFAFGRMLGVGMDFVAMCGGTAALLFSGRGVEDAIAKVNWAVILFFVGLFIVIGCVEATGALTWLSRQVVEVSGGRTEALVPLLSGFSAVASAVVDNIPVAATLIPIVKDIAGGSGGIPAEPLWWSLILGCNLGGNATPIGSISCVLALYTLQKEAGVRVGWGEFLKIGGTVLVVQLAGTIAYLLAFGALGLFPPLPNM